MSVYFYVVFLQALNMPVRNQNRNTEQVCNIDIAFEF